METERTRLKVNERFKTDEIVRSGTLFAFRGRVGRRERRREDEQEGEDEEERKDTMRWCARWHSPSPRWALDHMWAYYFKGSCRSFFCSLLDFWQKDIMDWVLWTLKLFPSSGEERALLVERGQFWSFPDQNGWSSILLSDSPQGFAVMNIYWITPLSVSSSILIKSDSIWMGDTVVHLLMMALTLFSLAYISVCSQNIMILATVSQMVCTSVHLGLGFLYFYPVLALHYHC